MTEHMDITPEREQDFWAQVDRTGALPCWLWRGGTDGQGYGTYYMNKRKIGAHRVAWCVENKGTLPPWHHVRHHCDNRLCVRPSHLKRILRAPPKTDKKRRGFSLRTVQRGEPEMQRSKKVVPRWRDFESYVRELKGVSESLHVLIGATSALEQKLTQTIEKIDQFPIAPDVTPKIDTLCATVEALRAQIETLTRAAPEPEPEPAPEPEPPEKEEPPAEPEPEIEKPRFGAVIVKTFREVLDFGEVDARGHEALESVFALMSADCAGDASQATEKFGQQLIAFVKSTREHDGADRSPAAFAKFAL